MNYQLSEIYSTLTFFHSFTSFHKLGLKSFSLVFSQLFQEGVFHLREEAAIKFVPLSCFQVALFHHSWLPEDVDFGTNEQVPALNQLKIRCIYTVMIEFLCFSTEYSSLTKYFVSLIVTSCGFPSRRYTTVIKFLSFPSTHQLVNCRLVISPIQNLLCEEYSYFF